MLEKPSSSVNYFECKLRTVNDTKSLLHTHEKAAFYVCLYCNDHKRVIILFEVDTDAYTFNKKSLRQVIDFKAPKAPA